MAHEVAQLDEEQIGLCQHCEGWHGHNCTLYRQDQRRRFLALVAGVVLITCTGCQTYTHPKFRERSAHLTTVAFLPPQIRTGMASASPQPMQFGDRLSLLAAEFGTPLPEEAKFRADLPDLIAAEFQKRGLTVKVSTLESRLPDSTDQIWNPRMRGILNAAYETMHLKAVRPEAKVLADHIEADGLVFVNVLAYKSTAGRTTGVVFNNIAMFVPYGGGVIWAHSREAIVQIALVDGETGDVLWRTKHDFTDLEKTGPSQVIAELFKYYPQH